MWRRNERTKHLHAPLHCAVMHCTTSTLGKKRRAREGRDERPMNASPKLVRYIRRYSCCKIGHTAPPRLCCATICERNVSEGAVKCVARDPWLDTQNAQTTSRYWTSKVEWRGEEKGSPARRCLQLAVSDLHSVQVSESWFRPSSCGTSDLTPLQKAI